MVNTQDFNFDFDDIIIKIKNILIEIENKLDSIKNIKGNYKHDLSKIIKNELKPLYNYENIISKISEENNNFTKELLKKNNPLHQHLLKSYNETGQIITDVKHRLNLYKNLFNDLVGKDKKIDTVTNYFRNNSDNILNEYEFEFNKIFKNLNGRNRKSVIKEVKNIFDNLLNKENKLDKNKVKEILNLDENSELLNEFDSIKENFSSDIKSKIEKILKNVKNSNKKSKIKTIYKVLAVFVLGFSLQKINLIKKYKKKRFSNKVTEISNKTDDYVFNNNKTKKNVLLSIYNLLDNLKTDNNSDDIDLLKLELKTLKDTKPMEYFEKFKIIKSLFDDIKQIDNQDVVTILKNVIGKMLNINIKDNLSNNLNNIKDIYDIFNNINFNDKANALEKLFNESRFSDIKNIFDEINTICANVKDNELNKINLKEIVKLKEIIINDNSINNLIFLLDKSKIFKKSLNYDMLPKKEVIITFLEDVIELINNRDKINLEDIIDKAANLVKINKFNKIYENIQTITKLNNKIHKLNLKESDKMINLIFEDINIEDFSHIKDSIRKQNLLSNFDDIKEFNNILKEIKNTNFNKTIEIISNYTNNSKNIQIIRLKKQILKELANFEGVTNLFSNDLINKEYIESIDESSSEDSYDDKIDFRKNKKFTDLFTDLNQDSLSDSSSDNEYINSDGINFNNIPKLIDDLKNGNYEKYFNSSNNNIFSKLFNIFKDLTEFNEILKETKTTNIKDTLEIIVRYINETNTKSVVNLKKYLLKLKSEQYEFYDIIDGLVTNLQKTKTNTNTDSSNNKPIYNKINDFVKNISNQFNFNEIKSNISESYSDEVNDLDKVINVIKSMSKSDDTFLVLVKDLINNGNNINLVKLKNFINKKKRKLDIHFDNIIITLEDIENIGNNINTKNVNNNNFAYISDLLDVINNKLNNNKLFSKNKKLKKINEKIYWGNTFVKLFIDNTKEENIDLVLDLFEENYENDILNKIKFNNINSKKKFKKDFKLTKNLIRNRDYNSKKSAIKILLGKDGDKEIGIKLDLDLYFFIGVVTFSIGKSLYDNKFNKKEKSKKFNVLNYLSYFSYDGENLQILPNQMKLEEFSLTNKKKYKKEDEIDNTFYKIDLDKGWNLIGTGNNNIIITDKKKIIIKNNIYKFEDNIYKEVDNKILAKGYGYWIKTKKKGTISAFIYDI